MFSLIIANIGIVYRPTNWLAGFYLATNTNATNLAQVPRVNVSDMARQAVKNSRGTLAPVLSLGLTLDLDGFDWFDSVTVTA